MGRVLHASDSGWFPFCIYDVPSSNVGQGTDNPLGLTLVKAMELYWRIKKWHAVITQDNPPPDGSTTADFFFERSGEPNPINPVSEEELVCFRPIGGDFFVSGFDQINITFSFIVMLPRNNLYYPAMGLAGNIISNYWGSIKPYGEIIGSIDVVGFGSINCYGAGGFSVNGTITPVEYWSYGGTYDTATGRPL